ncbi:MAG: tetratricopeptide repeat protein, partial [Rhodospirillales bacterium]
MTRLLVRLAAVLLLMIAVSWPTAPAQAQAAQDFEAGVAAAKAGSLPQAVDLFTKAIDAGTLGDGDLARVHNNRGATYRRLGNIDAAIRDFSRAIRLRPKYFRAHVNRGAAYGDAGKFKDAEEDYAEAVKLRPQDMTTFMERAKTRAQSGRLDTAILDLNEVLRVQPRNREALILRGKYYRSQGGYKRALE